MTLSSVEWRSYLDDILDEHMRTHVTVNANEYIATEVERLFNDSLHPIPEYSSSNFFLPTESLDTLLRRPAVQKVLLETGTHGPEEKWKASKTVLEYIMTVISSLSVTKGKPPTVECWLQEDGQPKTQLLDRPLLSRHAMKETPLCRPQGTPREERAKAPSNGHGIKKSRTDVSSTAFIPEKLRSTFSKVKLEEDWVNEKEGDLLISPRFAVPRSRAREVLACIKNTPFSSAVPLPGAAHLLPSEAHMHSMDDLTLPPKSASTNYPPISPPLFPRPPKQQNDLDIRDSEQGLSLLKEHMSTAHVQMDEDDDPMEAMRLVEGWPTIPIEFSSTPALTADVSGRSGEDDTEDVIQIDELMAPSSPPVSNKELKGLFNSRMEEILLPKSERLPRGRTIDRPRVGPRFIQGESLRNALVDTLDIQLVNNTLDGGINETRDAVAAPKLAGGIPRDLLPYAPSILQSIMGVAESDDDLDLGVEVTSFLDKVCTEVRGVDKYAVITRERIEEKDGSFMRVPQLPDPSDQIYHDYIKPSQLRQLGKAFSVLDPSKVVEAPEALWTASSTRTVLPTRAFTFLQSVGGDASLQLELSWTPFVYHGPMISPETICLVHGNPFLPTSSERANLRDVRLRSNAKEMIERLDSSIRNSRGSVSDQKLKNADEATPGTSTPASAMEVWSNDGILILTKKERARLRDKEFGSKYAPQDTSKKDISRLPDPLASSTGGVLQNTARTETRPTFWIEEDCSDELDGRWALDASSEAAMADKRSGMLADIGFPEPENDIASEGNQTDLEEVLITDSGSSRYGPEATDNHRFVNQHAPFEDFGHQIADDHPTIPKRGHDTAHQSFEIQPPGPILPGSAHQTLSSFSKTDMLRSFLEQRGVATDEACRSESADWAETLDSKSMTAATDNTAPNPVEGSSSDSSGSTLPDVVSQQIVLPDQWTLPAESHHYIASLAFLQRRALVQCLKLDCNVRLTEIADLVGPDLIIDSHSAVVSFTISEVVPSNLTQLAASIIELAYSFSRILVVLEAYPKSRVNDSLDKLRRRQSGELRMMTEVVVETCKRLKRNIMVGVSVIGVGGDGDEGDSPEIGEVSIDFVLANQVEDTARFIRVFANYAEASVSEWERQKLWGSRQWLETSDQDEAAAILAQYRGMNVFAALAISSVTPLRNFVDIHLEEKLHKFGALIGPFRMALFDALYRKVAVDLEVES